MRWFGQYMFYGDKQLTELRILVLLPVPKINARYPVPAQFLGTCFVQTQDKLCNDSSIFRYELNTPWLSVTAIWASTIFVATGSVAVAGEIITLLLFLSLLLLCQSHPHFTDGTLSLSLFIDEKISPKSK